MSRDREHLDINNDNDVISIVSSIINQNLDWDEWCKFQGMIHEINQNTNLLKAQVRANEPCRDCGELFSCDPDNNCTPF